MRRTLTVVLLTFTLVLPLCAQRRGSSGPRGGGSPGVRSGPTRSTFSPRGGGVFRGATPFGGGVFRGATPFRGGMNFRGGISFGHNPRFNAFFGSRSFHHHPRFSVYPNRYTYSYVYPYVVYPAYPLSSYDAYDYVTVPTQPGYAYEYGYASGEDNYPPDAGLAQQMRQQGVGVYAQPRAAMPAAPAPQPQAAPEPERQMPATVLIYRDGRRSEVRNYAIVGQTLWTFNERQAQKVPLEQLDLDATRKVNDERGTGFVVPQ